MVKRTTHCKYMHPLSGDNVYISPSGKRFCNACKRVYRATYRLKKGHVPHDPTRCRRGHLLDAENTVIKKSGRRGCRICMESYNNAYRANIDREKENDRRRKPGGLADRHRHAGATAERAKIVTWLQDNAKLNTHMPEAKALVLLFAKAIEDGVHSQEQSA